MKALILAAGEGSRLRPLSVNRPKPMFNICGKPILEHIIDLLKSVGITDLVVVVGYKKEAITDYFVVREYHNFSLVRLMPRTGRTHQLRVHLSHYGSPILGDRVYGKGTSFERLALHAYGLEFCHPVTGHMIMSYSPFPPLFRKFLQKAMMS